jgi:hypothetical protein
MKQSIRFWVWHNNGLVRLTLERGNVAHVRGSRPTDEGYSAWSDSYTWAGDTVRCEFWRQSRDCDGLTESSGIVVWDTVSTYQADDGTLVAQWTEEESEYRDYAAEAMGY